jgi:hypothetical protein
MQEHRTAGAPPAPSPPNAPPAIGSVQAFGVVDALRVDVQRAHLPWLVAEIDDLRASLERLLHRERASYDELSDIAKRHRSARVRELEQEIARREYQLQTLAMIRGQLPVTFDTAGVGDMPADAAASRSSEPLSDAPASLVGPAVLIAELLAGSAFRAARTLTEALPGPRDLDRGATMSAAATAMAAATPRVTERLRSSAAAAHQFTDILMDVLALQAYTFDPDYTPVRSDELV